MSLVSTITHDITCYNNTKGCNSVLQLHEYLFMSINHVCMHVSLLLSTYAPPSKKLVLKLRAVSGQVVTCCVKGICESKLEELCNKESQYVQCVVDSRVLQHCLASELCLKDLVVECGVVHS